MAPASPSPASLDPPAKERAAAGAPRRSSPVGQIWQLLAKDLRVEWRSREIVYTMCFFAVLVVIIFCFAFVGPGSRQPQVAGGILWVVIPLAGTLGIGRAFEREREGETHRALLLSPVSPAAIYLGKLLGIVVLIGLAEVVVVPLLFLLFDLQVGVSGLLLLLLLLLLGTVGFAGVGSLFGAALLQSRSRDVLLAVLLFPIVTPLLLAGAKGTGALLAGEAELENALLWIKLAGVFDVVFVTLGLWTFGPLSRGD